MSNPQTPPPPRVAVVVVATSSTQKKTHPLQHLIGGGIAGLAESTVCHPLDTLKTRMQLRRQAAPTVTQTVIAIRHSLVEPALRFTSSLSDPTKNARSVGGGVGVGGGGLHEPALQFKGVSGVSGGGAATAVLPSSTTAATATVPPQMNVISKAANPNVVSAPLGPWGTAKRIVQREGFFALYKGLSAVYAGIIPKMAIRFVSFEQYKEWGQNWCNHGQPSTSITFTAGLASGLTEAVLVVTPAEVCKIRMQSQYHSLMDPTQMAHRKYTNVLQTALVIVREEGISALYKGVVPTMLRQGCNQAVNFTAYSIIKQQVLDWQGTAQLASWQSLLIGGVSGGMGPLVNNPLDVIKTRLQKQVVVPGKAPKYSGLLSGVAVIAREEGFFALWKGITPRLLRIVPGQAITFMTYEAVSTQMSRMGWFQV
jgi:solute carrier family 25 (mitochondrial citrate transporter), member 1